MTLHVQTSVQAYLLERLAAGPVASSDVHAGWVARGVPAARAVRQLQTAKTRLGVAHRFHPTGQGTGYVEWFLPAGGES